MEPYIGTVMPFGFSFAPLGWALCDGSSLSIAVNTTLYALIGTTYGGNGQVSFELPNLKGRTIIGSGRDTFGNQWDMGLMAGQEEISLTVNNLAQHTHAATTAAIALPCYADTGNSTNPETCVMSVSTGLNLYSNLPADDSLKPFGSTLSLQPAGGNIPIPIISPYVTINYCIAVEGLFPTRN